MSDSGGVKGIVGVISIDGMLEFDFRYPMILDKVLRNIGSRGTRIE